MREHVCHASERWAVAFILATSFSIGGIVRLTETRILATSRQPSQRVDSSSSPERGGYRYLRGRARWAAMLSEGLGLGGLSRTPSPQGTG